MGLRARALAVQLQRLRRDRGAATHAVRPADHRRGSDTRDPLFRLSRPRRRADLVRFEHRPRQARPLLDGGARHGHRRRADGHQAAQRQAHRLRRLLLFRRGRRGDDDLPLVWRRRGQRRLHHPPLLHHPVHGDHRRSRLADRLLLRRRLPVGPADGAEVRPAGTGRADRRRGGRARHLHAGRRTDHHLPDRRAARPRPTLADRKAEIADVALPLLTSALSVRLDPAERQEFAQDQMGRETQGQRPAAVFKRRASEDGAAWPDPATTEEAYDKEQHHQERRSRRASRRRRDRRPGQCAGDDLLLQQRLSHRPVLGLGHPDRRRHARLHQHDQRARRRRERRQGHL
ncbi:conserved hypothetical protein [Bosea sp. EC-HK365B]|nr:conserved hypothetical protein [Bosea sp. 7B]CAD5282000.1 conserved hypothetical protein [Bosea sp. 21B]VVT52503.1 conserved hypothetical protein [Bosea sp. EC-HK365B]VXB83529.1 conserved hypothetical protein [Bosea sp. 127]